MAAIDPPPASPDRPRAADARSGSSGTVQATFCATLVDEWIRSGVRHAVLAPGSRSTPLALALAARQELAVHVFHDERSAAFAALGIGRASGAPAVLLCTSGTAAANFHPAVVEADLDRVPMVVCTADRPPELRDVGAPQTIDQNGLYGRAARWYHDPGVADAAMAPAWRSIAARTVLDAGGDTGAGAAGPVHLNLPFRDPLVADAGPLPEGRAGGAPWHRARRSAPVLGDDDLADLVGVLDDPRGVVIAGAGTPPAAMALAERVGWPVLADPRACHGGAATVSAFDAILRHPRFAADHVPRVVLRIGAPPASKVLSHWIASSGARVVHLSADTGWSDPDHHVDRRVVADPTAVCAALADQLTGARGTPWLARWRAADARAQAAIDAVLRSQVAPTDPAVARALTRSLPAGADLVVSSSMPIRDVEWYGVVRTARTYSNRGANGIDGVIATAVGVALADRRRPVALLIGDVAFAHDASSLTALAARGLDLTIVVVDNDGGAIFSFLPQRASLGDERFEQLFGTPHGTDLVALARAHHLDAEAVASVAELVDRLADVGTRSRARVLVVRTDRAANVAVHDAVHAAVRAAL